jgi:hypothetical protein
MQTSNRVIPFALKFGRKPMAKALSFQWQWRFTPAKSPQLAPSTS